MDTRLAAKNEFSKSWQHQQWLTVNDVATSMPSCEDEERRLKCRHDLRAFCESYCPERFYLGWSPPHLSFLHDVQDKILNGGKQCRAMPRGSGKTALLATSMEWAALYGHRRFLVGIAVNDLKAKQIIAMLKQDFMSNDRMLADFPEVIHPLRCLENKAIRCRSQHYRGDFTHSAWAATKIVFPTLPTLEWRDYFDSTNGVPADYEDVEYEPTSGIVFQCAGITSGDIRGTFHVTPGGETLRPDFVLLDDPQDDEVAHNFAQVQKREKLIDGAVLGMSGPTTRISGFMSVTVIADNDLASRYLNRKKKPEWHGAITKMVEAMPANLDKWDAYKEQRDAIYEQSDNEADALQKTNDLYASMQDTLEAGAVVSWPDRIEDGDLTAIQTAMHKYLYTPVTFASEYQNAPLRDDSISGLATISEIVAKTTKWRRNRIPDDASILTCYVDVQKKCLYYLVLAIDQEYAGSIVDYGTFPKQSSHYFTLGQLHKTLQRQFPGRGTEAAIRLGLEALHEDLTSRIWRKESGATLEIGAALIDAAWGQSTDVVKKFCKDVRSHPQIWYPSHGFSIRATTQPLNAKNRKKAGEHHYLASRTQPDTTIRHLRVAHLDANFWKTFAHERLALVHGESSSISLFAGKPVVHRMFAEHMHAETPADVTATNGSSSRTVREWTLRPERPDNHLLDCFAGACAAAQFIGANLEEHEAARRTIRQRGKTMTTWSSVRGTKKTAGRRKKKPNP